MTHLKELFLRDPAANEIVSGVSFTYSIFPPTNRKQRRVLIANIMPKRKKGGRARGKQSSNNVSRNRSSTTGSYGKKTTGLPLRSLTPSEVEVMVGSWREQGCRGYQEDELFSYSYPITSDEAQLSASSQYFIRGFFGVFDGHGGCAASKALRDRLHGFVESSLDHSYQIVEELKNDREELRILAEENQDSSTMLTASQLALLEIESKSPRRDRSLSYASIPSSSIPESVSSIGSQVSTNSSVQQIVKHSLRNAFAEMETDLYQEFTEESQHVIDKSGSTATCVLIMDDFRLYCANAGDSRAVMCRNGEPYPLSHDHNPYNKVEKKRVLSEGGRIKDQRIDGILGMTRSFGDFELKRKKPLMSNVIAPNAEVMTVQLTTSDRFVVLASDGIWGIMSNHQVVEFVGKELQRLKRAKGIHPHISDACERTAQALCQYALDLGSRDNVSCVIVGLRRVLQRNK